MARNVPTEHQTDVGGAQQGGVVQTDEAGGAPLGSSGLDADSPSPDTDKDAQVVTPEADSEGGSDLPRVRRPGDGAAGQSSL